jgi:hypothetical protein
MNNSFDIDQLVRDHSSQFLSLLEMSSKIQSTPSDYEFMCAFDKTSIQSLSNANNDLKKNIRLAINLYSSFANKKSDSKSFR